MGKKTREEFVRIEGGVEMPAVIVVAPASGDRESAWRER